MMTQTLRRFAVALILAGSCGVAAIQSAPSAHAGGGVFGPFSKTVTNGGGVFGPFSKTVTNGGGVFGPFSKTNA